MMDTHDSAARVRLLAPLLAAVACIVGCADSQRTGPSGGITALAITPDSVTVLAGQEVRFQAMGRMADGSVTAVRVGWTATGGTIDGDGRFIAGADPGDFGATATLDTPHLTAQARIHDRGALTSIVLVPESAMVAPGDRRQFSASIRAANGDTVAVPVTYAASGGTISAGGLFVAGQVTGDYRVIAAAQGGTLADTSPVTITAAAPTLARVVLVPPSATLEAGATQQFAAYGTMSNGDSVAVSVSFSATGGAISAGGLYSAGQAPGDYRVIATEQGGILADTSSVLITASGSAVVLVGAGDIADCGSDGDEATAALLDALPGTVFTAGDNAYSNGSTTDYASCYDPSWGRHRARTRPAPGNHDYNTSGAAGYFAYFGDLAGPSGRGYYSYDLGDWHIVSLNSEIDMSVGSAQETWLRADLAASTKQCTLAYWHKPRFSSGTKHGSDSETQPLWQALYDYDAEIAIAGHDHDYERFAPQTPLGTADPARGIREFVVGTGGSSHSGVGTPLPTSEVSNGTTFGVLQLTLGSGTYSWQFVPVAGATFTDAGSGTCH